MSGGRAKSRFISALNVNQPSGTNHVHKKNKQKEYTMNIKFGSQTLVVTKSEATKEIGFMLVDDAREHDPIAWFMPFKQAAHLAESLNSELKVAAK